MDKNLEKSLKKIENNPEIIYDELEKIFNVSYIEIWKYNNDKKTAIFLKDTSLSIVLNSGKTYQSIVTKSSLFSNHVVSSKAYVQTQDNPLNHKIKSIIITPYEENEQIVGFIRLFVSVKKRKNFTRRDVQNLELYKKTVLHFLGSTQENKPQENKPQKQLSNKETQILKTEILSLQKELNNYKTILKERNEENRVQHTQNKHLEEKLQEKEKDYLLLKESQLSQKQTLQVDKPIKLDQFLKKIYTNYTQHTNLMSFAEILYFVKIDAKISQNIDESLQKSKSILTLLESSNFEKTSYKERHILEDFMLDLKYFLSGTLKITKLKIYAVKKTPPSLFFNLKIVQSILLRFIIHVSKYIDDTKDLEIKFFYTEKILNIEILFTKIENKNKFNLFGAKKSSLYNSDQLIHNINQKMLISVDGNIQISDEKNIYKFLLTLPAYIIKL